jgi:recombination protein RecR
VRYIPKALEELIEALSQLPGVGPRSAERFAQYLLRASTDKSVKLAKALEAVHDNVKQCPVTFALIDKEDEVSQLYGDENRDKQTIALVADPFDIVALEKTSLYRGTYHVLGGLLSPLDGVGPEQLHIKELLSRIEKDNVKEIIVAVNASVEGETTALFIQQELADTNIVITRLARGLPIGVDLEYADQITLGRALEGRQSF